MNGGCGAVAARYIYMYMPLRPSLPIGRRYDTPRRGLQRVEACRTLGSPAEMRAMREELKELRAISGKAQAGCSDSPAKVEEP